MLNIRKATLIIILSHLWLPLPSHAAGINKYVHLYKQGNKGEIAEANQRLRVLNLRDEAIYSIIKNRITINYTDSNYRKTCDKKCKELLYGLAIMGTDTVERYKAEIHKEKHKHKKSVLKVLKKLQPIAKKHTEIGKKLVAFNDGFDYDTSIEKSLAYFLSEKNMDERRIAAKIIFIEITSKNKLHDLALRSLKNLHENETENSKNIDTMAYLVKALIKVKSDDASQLISKINHSTKNRKLKKYTKKALAHYWAGST